MSPYSVIAFYNSQGETQTGNFFAIVHIVCIAYDKQSVKYQTSGMPYSCIGFWEHLDKLIDASKLGWYDVIIM